MRCDNLISITDLFLFKDNLLLEPLGFMNIRKTILSCLLSSLALMPVAASNPTADSLYAAVQKQLARGWNTWDVRSVLTHVYMPYAY